MKADNKEENERKRHKVRVSHLAVLAPFSYTRAKHTLSAKEWVSCQTASSSVCLCVCPRLRIVLQTPQGCFMKLAMSTKADTTTV